MKGGLGVTLPAAYTLLGARLNERQAQHLTQFFRHLMVGQREEGIRYYAGVRAVLDEVWPLLRQGDSTYLQLHFNDVYLKLRWRAVDTGQEVLMHAELACEAAVAAFRRAFVCPTPYEAGMLTWMRRLKQALLLAVLRLLKGASDVVGLLPGTVKEDLSHVPELPERLPKCILNNKEPYQQDWRTTPHRARGFHDMTEYEPAEPALNEHLPLKLHSAFPLRLFDWANPEQESAPWVQKVLEGLEAGRPLVLGEEVAIKDAWGLDCYTHRNVVDVLL